jgi:hypothetical protein
LQGQAVSHSTFACWHLAKHSFEKVTFSVEQTGAKTKGQKQGLVAKQPIVVRRRDVKTVDHKQIENISCWDNPRKKRTALAVFKGTKQTLQKKNCGIYTVGNHKKTVGFFGIIFQRPTLVTLGFFIPILFREK